MTPRKRTRRTAPTDLTEERPATNPAGRQSAGMVTVDVAARISTISTAISSSTAPLVNDSKPLKKSMFGIKTTLVVLVLVSVMLDQVYTYPTKDSDKAPIKTKENGLPYSALGRSSSAIKKRDVSQNPQNEGELCK
ncbi:hypothetical protein AC249_AIPGENE26335 [Exaiptasia diaphana]|nr:hypothetical protein AC249_AIPGENE26335 [Exaiptasia diaphana]